MMEFWVLGSLDVRNAGTSIELGGPRQRAVLAALLLRANDVASIGYLAEAVWETPPTAPESNVRTYVAGLRRRLSAEGTRLRTCAAGYQLVVGDDELDLLVFEDLVERGARALGTRNYRDAITHLEQAVGLWRGRPLEGQPMGPAIHAELARLEERRLHAIELFVQAKIGLGQHDDVIAELTRLVAEHPLREQFWALLMLSLYRSGRQAEALDCFAQARTRLVQELGIEPGPTLQRLCQNILTSEATLAVDTRSQAKRHCYLPRDIEDFTGREAETQRLLAVLDDHLRARPAVVVSTIDGMAGAGKTVLAVHAAHLLAPRFPDGTLFVDLHGHSASHDPVDPADALHDLLSIRGVPSARIPDTLEARAALWRAELADRKVLIVLDDATSAGQVRPLMPGTPGSVALVTSRRRVAELETTLTISLDVMPAEDATTLFTRVVGDGRAVRGAAFLAETVRLCGYLPLAIRIAATRLRTRQAWTVDDLLARLRQHDGELAELAIGDRSVAAAFALSYRRLSGEQQRLFRLLGLVPGPDFDSHAAAALTGGTVAETEQLVEQLVDLHLLRQPTAGRYHLHDLVRTYAAHLAATTDDERAALTRLFDHYLHATSLAVRTVAPHDVPDEAQATAPALPDRDQALGWLEVERPNLLAAAAHAAAHGWPSYVGRFSMLLRHFLLTRSYHDDAHAVRIHALDALQGIGNRHPEGHVRESLGRAGC
jgi:DNA-binding SARP family transcriptional activator